MQSALLAVAAACALVAVDVTAAGATTKEQNPFHFLFNRCLEPDAAGGDVGNCARDLLREALERDRPSFSSGVQLGGRQLVLEPLQLPLVSNRTNDRPKWGVTAAHLSGLQQIRIDSVLLTEERAAFVVSFPELEAQARLMVRFGFLPLRPRLGLRLLEPRLLIGVSWRAEGGDVQLSDVKSQLWLDSYNVTMSGLTSMGTRLAKALNDYSDDIVEFMTPSLEAAVVRRIERSHQKERKDVLRWLENALS